MATIHVPNNIYTEVTLKASATVDFAAVSGITRNRLRRALVGYRNMFGWSSKVTQLLEIFDACELGITEAAIPASMLTAMKDSGDWEVFNNQLSLIGYKTHDYNHGAHMFYGGPSLDNQGQYLAAANRANKVLEYWQDKYPIAPQLNPAQQAYRDEVLAAIDSKGTITVELTPRYY